MIKLNFSTGIYIFIKFSKYYKIINYQDLSGSYLFFDLFSCFFSSRKTKLYFINPIFPRSLFSNVIRS
jgi:hypothetical protein